MFKNAFVTNTLNFFFRHYSDFLFVLKVDLLIYGLIPGAMRPGLDLKMCPDHVVVGLEGQGEWSSK